MFSTALSQDASEELIFPIVSSGFLNEFPGEAGDPPNPRFQMFFTFFNNSTTTVSVALTLHNNEGLVIEDENLEAPEIRTIPAGELSAVTILERFFDLSGGIIPPRFDGWGSLRIPTGQDIRAESELSFYESILSPVKWSAHSMAVRPAMRFQVTNPSDLRFIDAIDIRRRSGVAIVNPSADATAMIEIQAELFSAPRGVICSQTLTVEPLHRNSMFLDELCGPPTPHSRVVELVTITSNVPVAVGVLDVLPDGSFSSHPVQRFEDVP